MERELNMVVISDNNTIESREILTALTDISIPVSYKVLTPASVKGLIPIRANPAVGVILWATDLQGIVSDVEAFAKYLKGETEIVAALDTLGVDALNEDRISRAQANSAAIDMMLQTSGDDIVAKLPNSICKEWKSNTSYPAGAVVIRKGQKYRLPNAVTSVESQPPEMEGMLAVYRPINPTHAGTLEDPIPWVYGMDCDEGLYFSFNDKIYQVAEGGTMKPCTWAPDSGIWQWVVIE